MITIKTARQVFNLGKTYGQYRNNPVFLNIPYQEYKFKASPTIKSLINQGCGDGKYTDISTGRIMITGNQYFKNHFNTRDSITIKDIIALGYNSEKLQSLKNIEPELIDFYKSNHI